MKLRALFFSLLLAMGACTPAYYAEQVPDTIPAPVPISEIEHIMFSAGDRLQLTLLGDIVAYEFIACVRGTRAYNQFIVSELALPGILQTSVYGVTPESDCAPGEVMWHTHPPVGDGPHHICGVSPADMGLANDRGYAALLVTDATKRICFFTLEEVREHLRGVTTDTANLFVSDSVGRYVQ